MWTWAAIISNIAIILFINLLIIFSIICIYKCRLAVAAQKGQGYFHNQACTSPYFCVMSVQNPFILFYFVMTIKRLQTPKLFVFQGPALCTIPFQQQQSCR